MLRFVLPPLAALAALAVGAHAQGGDDAWRTDFSRHTVPLDEIVPGGPPKDGIPAIDRPQFVPVREAGGWLDPRDPVVVVEHGAVAKAYPLQILIWHEIVNDEVGGLPVAVTFCPLCNTALAFDRRHDGQVLDFGTTGRLRHSDLVMYDRQTESWWQQATGEGIVGRYAGARLRVLPAPLVSWTAFRTAHPTGLVLSRNTGHRRPYGRNPYAGYDDPRGSPFPSFFRRPADQRLPAMARVVAIELEEASIAVPFDVLAERRVVEITAGGIPLAVLWAPGTASALDAATIAAGRDVGATGVFDRRVDGRALTFAPAGDGRFHDRETGSTWDLLGRAVAGPLAGRRLRAVAHGNHFWFAWAAFRPDTRITR